MRNKVKWNKKAQKTKTIAYKAKEGLLASKMSMFYKVGKKRLHCFVLFFKWHRLWAQVRFLGLSHLRWHRQNKCPEIKFVHNPHCPPWKLFSSILYITWANIWIFVHQHLVKSNSNSVLSHSTKIIIKIKIYC